MALHVNKCCKCLIQLWRLLCEIGERTLVGRYFGTGESPSIRFA
jgi:hypothetical protein